MAKIPVSSLMRPRQRMVRMPVGGHVAPPPAPPVVEESPLVVEEESGVLPVEPEEPKMEEAVEPVSVDPLAGVSSSSTKAVLLQKAAELGLQVPDGAKKGDIWAILTASQV